MSNKGLIYVLINLSLPDLVKIGKTNRTSEERANELSSATGVPTPFIVAYDEEFDDCSLAERHIHSTLQQRGFRVANNREFFKMPLKSAIKVVIEAKLAFSQENKELRKNQLLTENDSIIQTKRLCDEIFEQAEDFLHGRGDTLTDLIQAHKLYKQAVSLGSSKACIALSDLYSKGMGCRKSIDKSFYYLNEGIKLGDHSAYAKVAMLYCITKDYDNGAK